jgi:hypothetical protein
MSLVRIGAIILTGCVVLLAILSLPDQQIRSSPVAMVDIPPPLAPQPKPTAEPQKNVAAIAAPADLEPLVRFDTAAGGDRKPVDANDGRSEAGARTQEALREKENAAVQQEPKGPGDLAAAATSGEVKRVPPAPPPTAPGATAPGATASSVTASAAATAPVAPGAAQTVSAGEATNSGATGRPTPVGTITVVRQANLRAKPHRNGQLIAMFQPGRELALLEAAPVRGYYRVSSGEAEGWIWREVLGSPQLSAGAGAAPAAQSISAAPAGTQVGN